MSSHVGGSDLDALGRPQWAGQPGRLEVWYATFTDAASGLGGWVHLETVAPTDGAPAYAHGWAAAFPADGPPVVERFGPTAVTPGAAWCQVTPTAEAPSGTGPAGAGGATTGWAEVGPADAPGQVLLRGATESLAWELAITDLGRPLYTFSRPVWERRLLPAAQIVPLPDGRAEGTLTIAGATRSIDGHGALARIYGHGNAERWGWLHAPLGDGAVLEIVTATARRRTLRRVPPLALVQLRLPGEDDWPRNPVLAAPRLRTTLRPDGFRVVGKAGGRRIDVDVSLPAEASVALRYTDPDGATCTCTNSERASARIVVHGPGPLGHQWHLDGTAHAEIGARPATPTSR